MRISDWSSDVCSSDLALLIMAARLDEGDEARLDQIVELTGARDARKHLPRDLADQRRMIGDQRLDALAITARGGRGDRDGMRGDDGGAELVGSLSSHAAHPRSEEPRLNSRN